MQHRSPPRRLFLACAGTLVSAPALLLPGKAAGASSTRDVLSLQHTHTGETLSVAFRIDGAPVPHALGMIDHFLRDHRTGDVHAIDPDLLDQLHVLARITRTQRPFQVISGYRSGRTNEMLRTSGAGGVAKGSLHLQGRAIDIRLADVPLGDVRDAALTLRRGGVGFYAESNFVHLDSGRFRTW